MGDQGRHVGPWTLIEEIDEGDNGVVWLASGPEGQRVAVKPLKARRAQTESYKRFVREITFLLETPGLDAAIAMENRTQLMCSGTGDHAEAVCGVYEQAAS